MAHMSLGSLPPSTNGMSSEVPIKTKERGPLSSFMEKPKYAREEVLSAMTQVRSTIDAILDEKFTSVYLERKGWVGLSIRQLKLRVMEKMGFGIVQNVLQGDNLTLHPPSIIEAAKMLAEAEQSKKKLDGKAVSE